MRLNIFLFLCITSPFLAGWGHWGPKVKIGLSVDQSRGREILIKKLGDELEENRAELVLRDAKGDPSTQENQVRDLIAQGIQSLILIPADPQGAAPLVEAAHRAGIKVISLERLIPNSQLDFLVAFDDEKAGELEALALVKRAPQGRYLLLGEDSVQGIFQNIRQGQMKVLKPLIERGDLQIAASPRAAGSEISPKAMREMETILKSEKMPVNAVLAFNNEWAGKAVQALEKSGLSRKVPVAGIGEDVDTCRRILSGVQTLTVYHPPQKLAEESAYLAAKLARKATQFDCQFVEVKNGLKNTLAVLLTPIVVDAKNLDSTVIKDNVQKREDVYGK